MELYQVEIQKTRAVAPFFEDAINQVFLNPNKTFYVMDGAIGLGKALPNTEPVLTPDGWVTMGEIKLGDYVIGKDGKPTQVTGVHPQGLKPIHIVYFKDGTRVNCCADHLWTVRAPGKKRPWRTMSTQELIDAGITTERKQLKADGTPEIQYKWGIPITPACRFDNGAELPIHPYVLGALLGDGGFTHNNITFTNPHAEIVDSVAELAPDGVKLCRDWRDGAWHCRFTYGNQHGNPLTEAIKSFGMWGKHSYDKHIPEDYLYASLESREQLFQGLIETDGCILKNGCFEFNTTSEQLIKDFQLTI